MEKLDLRKQWKQLYQPSAREVAEVDVPSFNFLMVDGKGDPNASADYAAAIEALYAVSYTLKFMFKKAEPSIDYAVMPLESLWWADDPSAFTEGRKDEWHWTAMIMQPDCVDAARVKQAMALAGERKLLPALASMRFERFAEGRAAQIMYVGPFSAEGPTIQRVHDFIAARARLAGKHHEIYLSDMRRTDPQKWKTVIRQPMR